MTDQSSAETKYPDTPMLPQWVSTTAHDIGGLDLLGLRAPVNSIGTSLLTGITTITPTVRYVSLRSWLIRQYALSRQPDSWKSFRKYAEKIEAAVTVGNLLNNPSTIGLIGSEGANKILESDDDPVELKALVKIIATTIYGGPSEQLGISFFSDSGIPGLTQERGIPMAERVEQNIGNTTFAKQIKTDPESTVFSRDVLRELGEAFPIGSPEQGERECILHALLPFSPRGVETGRIATYGILLEIAQQEQHLVEDSIFEVSIDPDTYVPGYYQKWLDGWVYYLLRCTLAVVHEKTLAVVIDDMTPEDDKTKPWSRSGIISDLVSCDGELKEYLVELKLFSTSDSPLDLSLKELESRLKHVTNPRVKKNLLPRWKGIKEIDVMNLAMKGGTETLAILPVIWLLTKERGLPGHLAGEDSAKLLSHQGWGRLGLEQVILPGLEDMLKRNVTIREAIAELVARTVDQHLRIAWTRMAREPDRDVSLLSTDGDVWYYKKPFEGGKTASRLIQTIGWLKQLKLVDENGAITDTGRNYLEQIRKTLKENHN